MDIRSESVVSKKQKKLLNKNKKKNQFYGILFASPAILGFILLTFLPVLATAYYSLTEYTGFSKPKFLGLDNFASMFSGADPFFYKSLLVTIYFVFLNVPVCIIFAFLAALLLNTDTLGRSFFRTLIYMPSIIPVVASSMIWMWILNPDFGLLNMILKYIGLPTSNWIFGESSVIPSLVLVNLWSSGSIMVIFLAGLGGIPRQYFEAIEVDGGNVFHKFIYIIVPMMTPTIFFNTIMGIINSFQAFSQAYILTQGGPNNASLFYVYLIWREAFKNARMGYASALALILFAIIMIFTFVVINTSNRWVYYEGGGKKI